MKKSLMGRLFDSKVLWGIISVLLSLTIWVYVTSIETEEIKQTFRGVEVRLEGEDTLRETKNLVITEQDTETVTLEIIGPRRVVGALSASDLAVTIDVGKLPQSNNISRPYTVIFPDGIDSSRLQVSSKNPENINFVTSKLTEKQIQVKGSFDGSVAEGYTAEPPVFEPSTITVYGPENYLNEIDYAWVQFGSENVTSTYVDENVVFTVNKIGYDKHYSVEDIMSADRNIEFSCSTIVCRLPILKVREIPLSVNLTEGAGALAKNAEITIEPASISLAGDSAILDSINRITLATVDLSTLTDSLTEKYTIEYDESLKNLTGISEATVTVTLVGLETKSFEVTNIVCKNVTEGYAATVLSENLTVILRGSPEELKKIKSEDIRAVADLTDYNISTGQYMPVVKIQVDGYPDVGAFGEYTVSIEIRKEQ